MAAPAKYKKRPDGNYQTSITTGRRPDGKPIRKTIYAKTIKELEAKAAEYRQQLEHGTLSSDGKMTFAELAALWIKDYTPNISEKVRKDYAAIIKNHLNPVIGCRKLKDLKKHDLQAILNNLSADGKARSTMQKIKIVAASILELAADNDITPRNMFAKVKVPDGNRKERQPLTPAQKQLVVDTWQGHRMGFPALLMLYCGLRRGELIALTWRDIDPKEKTITINKAAGFNGNAGKVKAPKSKAGERVIPIPDMLMPAVLACRKKAAMLVCPAQQTGGMMSDTAFRRAWESYQHYLNIQAGGKDASRSNPKVLAIEEFTAHQMRHSYATTLYDAGVDILTAQRLLGHADVQTTMEIYTHLSKQKEQNSIASLNAYIGAEIAASKF